MAGVVEFIIRTQDKLSGPLASMAVKSTAAKGALDKLTQSNKELNSMMGTASTTAKGLIGQLSSLDTLKASMPAGLQQGFNAMRTMLPAGVEEAFSGLGAFITNPFVLAGGAATAAYMAGLKSSSARADYGKALGISEGSKVYDDVRKLRAYLGSEAVEAGKTLAGAGESGDRLVKTLSGLGAVAGGDKDKFSVLTGIFADVRKTGHLTEDSLKSLTDQGFKPLTLLQSKLGGTDAEWQKKLADGAISADDLGKALEIATTKGGPFSGVLDKMASTPTGMWDTISNKVLTFGENFGEKMVPLVAKGTDLLNGLLGTLFTIVDSGVDVLIKLATWGSKNADVIYAIAGAVGAGVLAYKGYQAAQTLSYLWMMRDTVSSSALATAKGVLAVATGGLTVAQGALNAAFIASPIGWVVGGLAALTGGIIYAWKHFEGFRKVIYGLWETMKTVFGAIGNLFAKTFEPIGRAIEAVNKKDWSGLASAAASMIYNLSPVGMASNAVSTFKDTDIKGSYNKGADKGVVSWQADKKSKQSATEKVLGTDNGKLADYLKGTADKKGSAASSKTQDGINAISGGGVKNITVSVGTMVKELVVQVIGGNPQDIEDKMEKIVEASMTRAIASATAK